MEKRLNARQAFLVADHVVCHSCHTVTPHKVSLDEVSLVFVFTCKNCKEETDEDLLDLSEEGRNLIS